MTFEEMRAIAQHRAEWDAGQRLLAEQTEPVCDTRIRPFTWEEKQLRKAAIAELVAVADRRDEWNGRPLAFATPTIERDVEDRFNRREMLANHALESTARTHMDAPNVCRWRASVREQVRMTRSFAQKALNNSDSDKAEHMHNMADYYHSRVGRWLQGYRRAIAHAREQAGE
ncbi:MAG: hypothetical protein QNJ62_05025 [Methyloceanibacter sp.]|nr:hypothetical protein [Methyloceanibacter sp.]